MGKNKYNCCYTTLLSVSSCLYSPLKIVQMLFLSREQSISRTWFLGDLLRMLRATRQELQGGQVIGHTASLLVFTRVSSKGTPQLQRLEVFF